MSDESPNHQQPLDAAEALPAGVDVSGLMHLGLDSDRLSPFEAETGHQAGSQFVPPAPEELAEHFPELEILECIGRGGMGCVYKARQRHLDRLVALKILPTELGRDAAFQERFTREARAMAKLTHPHIVTLHDFGFAGGMYYLVMEYMDGMNLRELLQAERPAAAETLAIVAQLADALQSAHEQGLIHRDIKPENILFDRRGHVKIADFGLVKLAVAAPLSTSLTRTRDAMGTPHYMAPEQWESPQSVDHRADIYSLGVILYEMLTGRIPIGRFDLPSEKTNVDARVDRICIRSMQRDPEKRYQQAGDMQRALQAAAAPAAMAAPAFLTEWIERVRVPGLLAQLLGFLAGILQIIEGFFRGIGRFINSQWEAFPLMTVIGCAVIVFACVFDWAIGTRRNERNGVVYMQQYGISAFDSATIVEGVLLENYWVVVAAAAIALIALVKRRHRLRSELLIALLSAYGMVHVILVYGYQEQKVFGRLNYIRDADFMRVELTINPFFVGVIFGLFFLGGLWNIAAMVYRSMDENDRGVRSICRSFYRVMMGDPTTYI